jgi:hypothetical protein
MELELVRWTADARCRRAMAAVQRGGSLNCAECLELDCVAGNLTIGPHDSLRGLNLEGRCHE